jgi:uncharacterized OsmC-like protein
MSEQESTAIAVGLTRNKARHYRVVNDRGAVINISDGSDADFTPVELLLAALAGCSAIDVDTATARHAKPERFQVTSSAVKDNHRLVNLHVRFDVKFEGTVEGAAAEAILPRALEASHTKLCTVSRTIEAGEKVDFEIR